MTKRKGWLHSNFSGPTGLAILREMKAVAAAASVPSSDTSTKALWMLRPTLRSVSSAKLDRSAAPGVKRSLMPMRDRDCRGEKGVII